MDERDFFKDRYNCLKESVEVMIGQEGECIALDLSDQPEEICLEYIEDVPIAMFVGQEDEICVPYDAI